MREEWGMCVDSIVIEDKTGDEDGAAGSRFLLLYIKFFLEICGYKVLEDAGHQLKSNEECRFQRIILVEGEKTDDKGADGKETDGEDAIWLSVTDGAAQKRTGEQMIDLLCPKLSFPMDTEEDKKSLQRLAGEYNARIFRDLYTVCYLYASRFVSYSGEEKLINASRSLARKCDEWEKLLAENYTWRDVYAYLYLANRTNEGLLKLRAYPYCAYDELEPWMNKLEELTANFKGSLLLKAEIIRNGKLSIWDHFKAFESLQESPSYCTRFWAWYAIGELHMERADIQYRGVYGDDKCRKKVKLNEPAMATFSKALAMNEDEIKIIYKLALQDERRGMSEAGYWERARQKFDTVRKKIKAIPIGQRTTLEFEYLYKTHQRLGYIALSEKEIEIARKENQEAYEVWEELNDYSLFEEIYGEEIGEVRGVLDKRHSDREQIRYIYNDEIRKAELELLRIM